MASPDLTFELKAILLHNGADLVGIGDLTQLPSDQRGGMPFGVSVAVKYPREIIRGISELPTPEYKQWYDSLNEKLDRIVEVGAEFLVGRGYRARAKSRAQVGGYGDDCLTLLPHKTVATRAGLGWVGKCALLVTDHIRFFLGEQRRIFLQCVFNDGLAALQPMLQIEYPAQGGQ